MLAHAYLTVTSRPPERVLVFLHGILGSGANWRTFASKVIAERPEWGALLVDLRLHGDSQGMSAPHTVDAAARDIEQLAKTFPICAIMAHSFGGKVALAYARDHDLKRLFLVDSSPGPRTDARGSESTRHIVDLLATLPQEFDERAAFTRWIEERGVSRRTAMWLAMNVRAVPASTKYAFRLDVAAIRAMIDDYFAVDLWPVLESPRAGRETHIVIGGASDVVSLSDRERGARCPHTKVHVIEGAGHWVQVDAPDALKAILVSSL